MPDLKSVVIEKNGSDQQFLTARFVFRVRRNKAVDFVYNLAERGLNIFTIIIQQFR